MTKTKINSDEFAQRLGAYSHGYKIEMGDSILIFTTGQIALDKDGQVLFPESAPKQADFIYKSLQKILEQSGASLDDVVKTTVYLTNMEDFLEISKIRNEYFKNSEPVSTLVEVNKLVKDGCKVEIEVIAVKKK